ncbi:hypothetical protein KSC_006220 [Ktedonobacter sp. SOSP1-52]|nr:hypothetical protein KSC_006220 [Ktedonobacter sp. SOSP1-52]
MKGKDVMEKKTYTADFKVKAVMESFQRDTTLEATCQKFGGLSLTVDTLAPRVPGEGSWPLC